MSELQIFSFVSDLFQQDLITKVELEEFKAKEKAINDLVNFRLSITEKKENLSLRKLKILEQRIDYSQDLIKKIKNIDENESDFRKNKKNKMLEVLDNFITISTNEITKNFYNFLTDETKQEFLKIEMKQKEK